MKAAILYEANPPPQVVDVEEQGLRTGEARGQVKATGICHSDRELDRLISRTYPLEKINEGVAALRAGGVGRGVVVFN